MAATRTLLHATALAALLAGAAAPARAAQVTLNETGSTLLYPLFQLWLSDYQQDTPTVAMQAAATGSGDGIDAAIAGRVRIGTSDAYMSDAQAEHNRQIIDIPLVISAQMVTYNIPGLNDAGLKLDGPTLAGIYTGRIATWDAAPIAAMNPGVTLPHHAIVPIRRSDASGDTFIFTQFLDFSTQSWEDRIGYGTTVAWPHVPAEQTASSNDAMVKVLAATPYAVAYVGVSFRDAAAQARLGTAMLKSQHGEFLLPTADSIGTGAASLDPRTPADERLSLVFAPGPGSYPLVNYEYAVVSRRQPDAATAEALRQFLTWSVALQGGNARKYLDKVGFIALPDFIRALSEAQINGIE